MPNISQLSTITTNATALANLILVTPNLNKGYQPQNPNTDNGNQTQPPNAILFHYEGEQTASLQSDITDHFTEENSAIQDQISLKPEIITTHGFVGELNDVVPDFLVPLKEAADKLTVLSAYTPELTTTAQIAYNNAFQLYQAANTAKNSAVSAWSSINTAIFGEEDTGLSVNLLTQTKQQQYFALFYGYWVNRILFTIQTPWAIFKNMAILSLRSVQDADTRMITDFEVTFKRIRYAKTETGILDEVLTLDSSNRQGRNSFSAQPEVNLGTSVPKSATETFSDLAGRIA